MLELLPTDTIDLEGHELHSRVGAKLMIDKDIGVAVQLTKTAYIEAWVAWRSRS
jgi:hypothetical protein